MVIHLDKFAAVRSIALLSWSAWLTMISVCALCAAGALPPSYPTVVVPLALQVVATVALVVRAVWQLARGPRRLHAAAWFLIGIVPVLFNLLIVTYGIWFADSRNFGSLPRWVVRPGDILVAALADAELRWRYHYRYEGRHAVMWCTEEAEAGPKLDAIDRHIDRLEQVLGQKCREKVQWVRGGLLGHSGRYWCGIALGSDLNEAPDDPNELPELDLHENAHFVIHHHCEASSEPPHLLIEGWAEAQSGYRAGKLALRAWQRKEQEAVLTLAELVSDDWYSRALFPVYEQGGPLVDYLLRTYGGEKFFELYSTCRRATFAEDCRRILGTTLDELDRAYWSDIERQVALPEIQSQEQPLRRVALAEGIDRSTWDDIASHHWEAYLRARRRFRQSRLNFDRRIDYDQGSQSTHTELACDWPRMRSVEREELTGFESIKVSAPEQSFRLVRSSSAAKWTTSQRGPIGVSKYDMVVWRDNPITPKSVVEMSYVTDALWSFVVGHREGTVTRLEPVEERGHWLLRFEFVSGKTLDEYARPVPRRGWFLLDPGENWSVRSYEFHDVLRGSDGARQRAELAYAPMIAGVSCLQERRFEVFPDKGPVAVRTTTTVSDVRFAATPLEEFSPQAFGVRPDQLADPAAMPWQVRTSATACLLSLSVGTVLLCVSRRRRPTSS